MRKYLSLFIAAVVLLTGCSTNTKPVETTTPKQTTASTSSTTTSAVSTSTTSTTEEDKTEEDDIFDYFKSQGTIIYEGTGDENSDLYTLIVEEEPNCVELYFILPEDTVENNVYMLAGTIEPYLDVLTDRTNVGFTWFDHEENYIANFSAVKLSGEWGSPMGLTWYDEEYKNTYKTLVEQSQQTEDTKIQENVLYDDNNILVISKELLDTRTGGKELEIYIENTSQSDYYVRVENLCINDYQVIVNGTWLSLAGKKLNDSIEIYSSELSDNNITEIDKIEFTLRFSNHENDEKFYSDVITLEY